MPGSIATSVRARRPLAVLALAALSVVAACSDSPTVVIRPLDATYALVLVDGRPLPAIIPLGGGMSDTVAADTLRFATTGAAERRTTRLAGGQPWAPDGWYVRTDELRYRRIDGRVNIQFVCPPWADCYSGAPVMHALLSDDETILRLDDFMEATGHSLVYTRLP